MTKTIKVVCSVLACLLLVLGLASCSTQKKWEKYAEDIRVAEAKGEALSYADVLGELGTPTVNLTFSFGGSGESGDATWYEGCENDDELEAKLEAGEEVLYIHVRFSGGKAVDAETGIAKK